MEQNQNQQIKNKHYIFDKGFVVGLIISFIIACLISTGVFLYEYYNLYSGELTTYKLYMALSDSFMFPWVMFALLYLLMWASKEGAFDAIVYSSKLFFYTIFYKNIRDSKLPASYREYRELKRSKPRSSTLFLLFAAIPFFILFIVFIILTKTSVA